MRTSEEGDFRRANYTTRLCLSGFEAQWAFKVHLGTLAIFEAIYFAYKTGTHKALLCFSLWLGAKLPPI